jgi:putative PIN family toxin of toxin-antitoxin system
LLRAVLDANVFISAAIRPEGLPGQLLRLFLRDEAFELVISPAIASEIAVALNYPAVCRCMRASVDTSQWLESILMLADLVEDGALPTPVSRDPDDDKYLHVAASGRASVVVSGDKDLLSLGDYNGIRMLTPRAFLAVLTAGR